jgi:hypothetical protein
VCGPLPPLPLMPKSIQIGFDNDLIGVLTASADGARLDASGPQAETVLKMAEAVAEGMIQDNPEMPETDLTPEAIMTEMVRTMTGRSSAVWL